MKINEILILYNYNYWATRKILKASEALSESQLVAPAKCSFESLRGTLIHILSTEWMWRKRCQEAISPTALMTQDKFPTLASIRLGLDTEEKAMREYIGGLDDGLLLQKIAYTTTRGVPYETPLWQILVHVVNHGTQFRSEAGMLLTDYGRSPRDIDFILYLRENSASSS